MLVCVGFALWLGITVMQFISSMEQKNPSILVKTILNKAFLVLIVVTLLRLNSADFSGWRWNRYSIPGLNWRKLRLKVRTAKPATDPRLIF